MRHITLGIFGFLCIASTTQAADGNWAGSYIGGDVGVIVSKTDARVDPLPTVNNFGVFPNIAALNDTAFSAGMHIGHNWRLSSGSIMGIEADWTWTDAKGSFTQPWVSIIGPTARPAALSSMSMATNWLATIRGRFGNEISPGTLAYVTGGIAFADVDYKASAINETSTYVSSASFSKGVNGFVVGGGLEWALQNRWSLRAEYLFHSLNTKTTSSASDSTGTFPPPLGSSFAWDDTTIHSFRVGANYKF